MSERIQRSRSRRAEEQQQESVEVAQKRAAVDYDALLDEIDGVLQGNAEEYVKNFVQKGGQ